jgi:diguanylate cyclase (GGDEF)-like protein
LATYALLVTDLAINGLNPHAWILLAGTIICSMLVWLRQLAAFRQIVGLSAKLRELAFQDGLTRLANRVLFMERLSQATAPTVFLIDLDHFKPVNDRYGHAAGDRLLEEVARRLLGCVRETDTLARLGGDEFAILIDNLSPEHRNKMSAAVKQALHDTVRIGEATVPLRASVGVATAGELHDPESLLHQADMAMYAAKQRSQTIAV